MTRSAPDAHKGDRAFDTSNPVPHRMLRSAGASRTESSTATEAAVLSPRSLYPPDYLSTFDHDQPKCLSVTDSPLCGSPYVCDQHEHNTKELRMHHADRLVARHIAAWNETDPPGWPSVCSVP
ncbi:hypothetical protein GCM10027612_44990 [Microbispora bryophytorum subsp. camponoti]